MKNIYYLIWVDAIVNIEKNTNHKKDWKFFSMLYMTLLNSLNLGFVLILLAYIFKVRVIWVKSTIFEWEMLNSFFSFVIQFALPLILLNYFLIFYRDRYKRLIQIYPDKNGKLFAAYLLCSIFVFIMCVGFYMWLL
jgi:hypothetical protein